jgi:hypothetical protein
MSSRCFLLLFLLSGAAAAQLSGRFYLDKETLAPGEPIFLYFQLTNIGSEPLSIDQANPYTFCSGYNIHVSSDEKPSSSCGSTGGAGSCLLSHVELKPKESRTERILLNFEHKIEEPGEYLVEARRSLSYADTGVEVFRQTNLVFDVQTELHFRIDPGASLDHHGFDIFVAQLRSSDLEQRTEAARTLATLAPSSLEKTLLTFADEPQFKQFAPLALHRLNTPRSMSVLADLLRRSAPGTAEYLDSARYLAESGDLRWFPLLLEVAQKNPKMLNYVQNAAESGGPQMLPYLFVWMQSSDTVFTRPNAVTALGYTGSRDAIPTLIDLLKDPDLSIAQRALWGLRVLTHLKVAGDHDEPRSQYPKWLRWWALEGATAHIYKAQECGEIHVMP